MTMFDLPKGAAVLKIIWFPINVVDGLVNGAYNGRPTWRQTTWREVALSVMSYALAGLALLYAVEALLS